MRHAFVPKFLDIPTASEASGNTQIGDHKAESADHRAIERAAGRRSDYRQREIDETFRQVMRRDETCECRMVGDRIRFQRSEIAMAIVLDARGDDKKGETDERLEAWGGETKLDQ